MLNACYILHRRKYRESSLLLDVFSLEHGKLSLIAKGAYTSKSPLSAQLQPFQPLLIQWKGRSELKTLTKIETPSQAFAFMGKASYSALYMNELLQKLLPSSRPVFMVFTAYAKSLAELAEGLDPNACLRVFEFILLHELGQLPDCRADWCGEPVNPSLRYYISEEGQYVAISRDGLTERGAAKNTRIEISGQTLILMARLVDAFDESSKAIAEPESSLEAQKLLELGGSELRILLHTLIKRALNGASLVSRELMSEFIKYS